MKYKKFLAITLVTFLLVTSISAVSMARISVREVKNITINETTKGLISNFLIKLQEVFPVLAKFFKNIKSPDPSTPDTDTCPKLLLDISVGEKFTLEEPIIVEATLTNLGRGIVRLCEMNFKVGTLDYFIKTPDGYELHFIGVINDKQVLIWTLLPKESRSIDIDIKCGLFNVLPYFDSDSPICEPYKFVPGDYSIYAVYNSFVPEDSLSSVVNNIWQGTLKTGAHYFTIEK